MVEKSTIGPSDNAHPLIRKVLASKPPIAELIGFNIEEIGQGQAVGSLQSRQQHANPMGNLHGGVLCDVVDAVMGTAFASTLDRVRLVDVEIVQFLNACDKSGVELLHCSPYIREWMM